MPEFFLRLLIALIIFIPTVYFFASLFRLSSSALDDYNNLAEKIKQVSVVEGEYKDNAVLRMDKGTAILGFKKDSDELLYEAPINTDIGIIPIKSKFLKPDECENKACICLCRKAYWKRDIIRDFEKKNFGCDKRICNKYENIDFTGFVIETFSEQSKKLSSVYIHKYEDFIGICLEQPCITDEMKKEIDKNE